MRVIFSQLIVLCLLISRVAIAQSYSVLAASGDDTHFAGRYLKADQVSSFKGIRYAQPTTGDQRWTSPRPYRMYKGVNEAYHYGPACTQPPAITGAGFPVYGFDNYPTSEDCLYLNIWTSARVVKDEKDPEKNIFDSEDKKKPVMVSIHGGGLLMGASQLLADGSELAAKGVVVVSFNYRLGVFGYFSHPELSAGVPNKVSGNYGTLDQIQALKWVQENIADFGGDPNNVTIFGVSAGALSVAHMLTSPLAEGLFHKAIMQSNILPRMPKLSESYLGQPSAEQKGSALAKAIGSPSLSELKRLPPDQLMQASMSIPAVSPEPEAVVDDWVFKTPLLETFRQGRQHKVPVLAGISSGEGLHFSSIPDWSAPVPESAEDYEKRVQAIYADLTNEYLTIYPATDLVGAVTSPIRDRFYLWPTESYTRSVAESGEDAYFYYFDHALPDVEAMGLRGFHVSEMPFVFNNVKHVERDWPKLGKPSAKDLQLAETISDYWVNFAKSGSPNMKGRPTWEKFSVKDRAYMNFKDGQAIPSKQLLPGVFELHEKIYQRRKDLGMNYGIQDIGLQAPALSRKANKSD